MITRITDICIKMLHMLDKSDIKITAMLHHLSLQVALMDFSKVGMMFAIDIVKQ